MASDSYSASLIYPKAGFLLHLPPRIKGQATKNVACPILFFLSLSSGIFPKIALKTPKFTKKCRLSSCRLSNSARKSVACPVYRLSFYTGGGVHGNAEKRRCSIYPHLRQECQNPVFMTLVVPKTEDVLFLEHLVLVQI